MRIFFFYFDFRRSLYEKKIGWRQSAQIPDEPTVGNLKMENKKTVWHIYKYLNACTSH